MDAVPMTASTTLRTIDALAARNFVRDTPDLRKVAQKYAVAITPDMAALIEQDNGHGGISLQFVPQVSELSTEIGQTSDPIADLKHEVSPGLIHRYRDRVLLKVHHACPVYCRFCFRREMVGPNGDAMSVADLAAALDYLVAHPEIREVILTGGDPFMLSPKRASDLTARLSALPHIDILRWHTRVPVVDPDRITDAFAKAVGATEKSVFVGVHANHPDEFTPTASAALARLHAAGVMLVSQSVLLRGVNDDVDTLERLMRACLRNRIKPYYLHQMDPAPGTAHFVVPIERGRELIAQLRDRMTGLGVPSYVLDGPAGRKRHLGPEES
jgi:lysine 2,3-aminomutase